MLDDDVYQRVRASVCAVGYFVVPVEEVPRHIRANQPIMDIVGTAFLVRDSTLLTNRHVVQELYRRRDELGVPLRERACAQFVYPHESGWQTAFGRIESITDSEEITPDIAFLEFERPPRVLDLCQPVVIHDAMDVRVGQEIAVCGYPLGTTMLMRGERQYRFGAVLQQGHISAKAPFDNALEVEELLLDLRATVGMSGSPVFLPEDGAVVGVIASGYEEAAVTALAVPMQPATLAGWLDVHDQARHAV